MRIWLPWLGLLLIASTTSNVAAQDRDTKVRNDRKAFEGSLNWIYNNLDEGIRAARSTSRPLLVVFRCIPCEACQEFDDDVARRDPVIRDLLDQFVCVRIVQANDVDLSRFQHDFDQSFAAYLMNPDGTIYGRFGTRSERPEAEDISLEGLREAMEGALRIHRSYDVFRPLLAGKQVRPSRFKTPRDFPSLSGKYDARLNYEGQVAKSCMHCHQIREAERLVFRSAREAIPEVVLFPYPDPGVLGLKMDPTRRARIERVESGSAADRAGLRPGDELDAVDGQPLLSIADLQWILHNSPPTASIPVRSRRGNEVRETKLELLEGWRRGNISWRVTSWDLRRMAFGGLKLTALTDSQRAEAKLPENAMGLRVEHVGEYGEHAVAKQAGFRRGDILISYDGQSMPMTESELLAYALQAKRPGDKVAVTVLRDGQPRTLNLILQ
jgi:hypothetical protein